MPACDLATLISSSTSKSQRDCAADAGCMCVAKFCLIGASCGHSNSVLRDKPTARMHQGMHTARQHEASASWRLPRPRGSLANTTTELWFCDTLKTSGYSHRARGLGACRGRRAAAASRLGGKSMWDRQSASELVLRCSINCRCTSISTCGGLSASTTFVLFKAATLVSARFC